MRPSGRHAASLGRALPIPAWALVLVGGAVAALLFQLVRPQALRGPQGFAAALLYGAACGGLAGVAVGRVSRRTVLFGTAIGAGAGACFLLAAVVHEAFVLPGFITLTALPAAAVAFGLRLSPAETTTLCALSLTIVAAASLPLGMTIYVLNAEGFKLPDQVVATALAALEGSLAWTAPARWRFRPRPGPGGR